MTINIDALQLKRGNRRKRQRAMFDNGNGGLDMIIVEVESIQPQGTKATVKKPFSDDLIDVVFISSAFDCRGKWRLDENGDIEKDDSANLVSIETARLKAGNLAVAEISAQLKATGALGSLDQSSFDELNEAGNEVFTALAKGQFITAIQAWRSVFSADSLSLVVVAFVSADFFDGLNSSVDAIIRARIKQFDGLSDAQIDSL